MEDEKQHHCYECGYYRYNTHYNEERCNCEENKTFSYHTIVSGRETNCEDWKSNTDPEILKERKLNDFFDGKDRYPDMEVVYEQLKKYWAKDEKDKEDITASFLAQVYNAALKRCHEISGVNFYDHMVSDAKPFVRDDKIKNYVSCCIQIAEKYNWKTKFVDITPTNEYDKRLYSIHVTYDSSENGDKLKDYQKIICWMMGNVPQDYILRIVFVLD